MLTLEWDINEARQAWREDALEEGRAEGIEEGRAEVALKMLSRGFSPKEIHDITELPIERINQLITSA